MPLIGQLEKFSLSFFFPDWQRHALEMFLVSVFVPCNTLQILSLDPEAYYIATVPIAFNWPLIIALNIGTLIASMLMMVGPSYLITKILPAKIIRYE